MIGYWTKPYPDEILYSIVARHINHFGNGGPKQLLLDLFGRSSISSTLDLPSGLSYLAERIDIPNFTMQDIINNHTLFPYYVNFMAPKERSEVIDSMLYKSGDIHTKIGINAGPFSSCRTPRYCQECCKNDLEEHGETFFRRAHQLPALQICTKHNMYLCKTKIDAESINKHFFIKPTLFFENNLLCITKSNPHDEILEISKKLESTLCNKLEFDYKHNPYYYNETIKKLGFRKGMTSLDLHRLYNSFHETYDNELLKHFKSIVDISNENCWLKSIFRKHRKKIDPVRHILTLNFIEHLKLKQSSKPTLKNELTLLVCRNPICKEYNSNKKVIWHIIKDPKSNREITYVTCECGYSYTRSYIESKQKLFIRVKEFGKMWESELLKLVRKGLSSRAISRRLHAAPKTIKNYFNKEKRITIDVQISIKQKQWEKFINKFPNCSITELRNFNPALYTFLYRHSRNWLLNKPYKKQVRAIPARVNWKNRDALLLNEVKKAYEQLKRENPRRRRSTTALLKLIGKDSIYRKNIEKLPALSAFLKQNCESLSAYRLRRLAIATKQLRKNNKHISYWQLLRAAGIRKEYISYSIHQIALKIVNGELAQKLKIEKSA